jgi:hypothetical protein
MLHREWLHDKPDPRYIFAKRERERERKLLTIKFLPPGSVGIARKYR